MSENRVNLSGVDTKGCLSFDYHIEAQLCKITRLNFSSLNNQIYGYN